MQPDYAHLLDQTPCRDTGAFNLLGFVRDLASLAAISAFVCVLYITLERFT